MPQAVDWNNLRNELKPEIKKIANMVVTEICKVAPKVKTRIYEDESNNLIYVKQFFLEELIEHLSRKV